MKKLVLIVFLFLITVPSFLWFLGLDRIVDYDIKEKRILSDFPEVSCSFLQGFYSWYTDHAPFRNVIIETNKKLTEISEMLYCNKVLPFFSKIFIPNWFSPENYERYYNGSREYIIPYESNNVIHGKDGWLFWGEDGHFSYFRRVNILSEVEMNEWICSFNKLDKYCKEKGITLIYAVFPEKEAVYSEYVPTYKIDEDTSRGETLYDYINSKSNISYFYPLKDLIEAKSNGIIYMQQDSHWNCLGAYYALKTMEEVLQVNIKPISENDIVFSEQIGGDLVDISGFKAETYKLPFCNYRPEIELLSNESFENSSIEITKSSSENEHKLVFIGDSYRLCCEPFLKKEYSETMFLHRDFIDNDIFKDYLGKLCSGDVLVISAVERFDDSLLDVTNKIYELFIEN